MNTALLDSLSLHELIKLVEGFHHDPHTFLGLHTQPDGSKLIRLWRPGASASYLELLGTIVQGRRVHDAGLFVFAAPSHTTYLDYRVYHHSGLLGFDPYGFLPTFGELDQYLFAKGVHYDLHQRMGGRICSQQGVAGVKFAVWAPNAKSVALVADFNHWDGRVNPMRVLGYSGVWELFIPGIEEGEKYKFEITTQQGKKLVKADPYAYSSEKRPSTASVIAHIDRFKWNDEEWLKKRASLNWIHRPINIYELHLGSWKKKDADFLNYRDIAHALAPYCREMGYTHVELMPIQEHPLDESWGYQVSGFYAPTSRYGTPEDFQFFVDEMHRNDLGVILDWVPGHFPMDEFSLGKFDGSALYEHADPRKGYHPHWHTHIFNFGRHEVANFLIANGLYWFREMHLDGLRVDAVASMLYLDYGREGENWIPNQYGGKENLEAIEFLKHFNAIVHAHCPGVLTIAEESTAFAGITQPVERGGLGFDFKWNMGWMNDTLHYFTKDMLFRSYHHQDLTFGLLYCFSEKFISVLSHDEVVHGKKNLLAKMPGDVWQQFANLRLLLSYLICQPGKKLLFMGTELGQWNEWDCKRELEWHLLRYPVHSGLQRMCRELNHFYLAHPALWERDGEWDSFEWVDFSDVQNSVVSYQRTSSRERVLCVHHFTPSYHPHYLLYIKGVHAIQEVFNSDDTSYGGSGKSQRGVDILRDHEGVSYAVRIELAPLATMIFKIE